MRTDLFSIPFGKDDMNTLLRAIANGALANLEILLLPEKSIGDEGIKAFSTVIASQALANFEYLGLCGNHCSATRG